MNKSIMILLSLATGISFAGNESGAGNVCYTQDVVARRGSPFSVSVNVNNADTLAGMQIPIYYRSETVKLRCDSVTFRDTRCDSFASKIHKIDPAGRTVYFVVVCGAAEFLPPGDGPVARLWFTADDTVGSGRVELFSGPEAFLPDEKIDYNFLFWSPSAKQLGCQYRSGFITIK